MGFRENCGFWVGGTPVWRSYGNCQTVASDANDGQFKDLWIPCREDSYKTSSGAGNVFSHVVCLISPRRIMATAMANKSFSVGK